VPGYDPRFGQLGDATPASPDLRTAGRADSILAGSLGGMSPGLLLAVLLLAGVTAALVRTWALRRSGVIAI
jgi:hypothetical protein